MSQTIPQQPIEYNMKVVRQFTVMTIIWGIVGMALGVLIAAQLVWPELNFNTPWLTTLVFVRCIPMRLFSHLVPAHFLPHLIMWCKKPVVHVCSRTNWLRLPSGVGKPLSLSLLLPCLLGSPAPRNTLNLSGQSIFLIAVDLDCLCHRIFWDIGDS